MHEERTPLQSELSRNSTPLLFSSVRFRAWFALLLILLFAGPRLIHAATPEPTNSPPLCSWSFQDVVSWYSDAGYAPISFTNIISYETNGINCLIIDSTNSARLQYNVVENDGQTNLTVNAGTILFWYSPKWTGTNQGGAGPGQSGRLIEVGSFTTNASYGWWSLGYDSSGNISFSAQTNNGSQGTYLAKPVAWNTNNGGWVHIALTYSSTSSALYINGSAITNGSGVTYYPGTNVLSKGFCIGSDTNGTTQAKGAFSDIYTFNYPFSSDDVATFYTLYSIFQNPGSLTSITSAPSTVVTNPVFKAITGAGYLTYVSNTVSCVTNSSVWLTNLTAKLLTNNSVSVTFGIGGGSNALFYDVFATSALQIPFTNAIWAWMGQGEHCKVYTITNLPSTGAYLVLGTPDDSDSDGLTSAYESLVTHTSPTNSDTDSDGVSDGWEVVYGTDPNAIDFSVTPTNPYSTNAIANVQAWVTKGIPAKAALLVDSTNFTSAVWTNYTNVLPANLGSTNGWHTIWVGLRGWPENSQQTWESTRIKLDTSPPILVITNPASGTVSRPVIQVQGYSWESLGGLSYDITNAAGLVTNAMVFVVNDQFDTNSFEVTTNYFQCFDVALTNGANTITIRATDLAGNTTVTNISLTLSYASKTNPPIVKVGWPQSGTKIAADTFTWRGLLDDPTSKILVQSVDTNGVTNVVSARVGRDGDFWVENVPFSRGTNSFTLITTDAAGNSCSTNISVTRSSVNLTVDNPDWLWSSVLSGTISTNGYTVWVNGIQTDQTDGHWSTSDLQLTLDDTVLQVRAVPNSDNGGQGSPGSGPAGIGGSRPPESANQGNPTSSGAVDFELPVEWPTGLVYIDHYRIREHHDMPMWAPWIWLPVEANYQWVEKTGGAGEYSRSWWSGGEMEGFDDQITWAAGRWPVLPQGTSVSLLDGSTNNVWDPPQGSDFQNHADFTYTSPGGEETFNNSEQAELTMLTGGKPGETEPRFITLSGAAGNSPPELVQVAALGKLDTNGNLTLPFPPRTQVRVTPQIRDTNRYAFSLNGTWVKPVSETIATTPTDRARTNLGVGEEVNLKFMYPLNLGSPMVWGTTAGSISQQSGEYTKLTAPSNAGPVTVRAVARGATQRFDFMVYAPTGVAKATITSTTLQSIPTNTAGAWMRLKLILGPTNVSLHRVQVFEQGSDATNITHYFTNHTPGAHNTLAGANTWHTIPTNGTPNNVIGDQISDFMDTCSYWGSTNLAPPWTPVGGGFKWPIPAKWRIPGGPTNTLPWSDQEFAIDANGTFTITKFLKSVTRSTNNVITPRL